jgi:hypothetical protein
MYCFAITERAAPAAAENIFRISLSPDANSLKLPDIPVF